MSKANMDAFKKEFGDDNFSNSDVLDLGIQNMVI